MTPLSLTGNTNGYVSNENRRRRSSSHASSGRGGGTVKSSNDISPASMIFRNLLILEDDLRRQASEQKWLRRQFTSFLTVLFCIAAFSIYALYFMDIYNASETTSKLTSDISSQVQKVACETITSYQTTKKTAEEPLLHRSVLKITIIFITVTFALFHISGEYKRTIVIPRKFFSLTNKGLRQFNVKLVKVENTMNERLTDLIRFITRISAKVIIYVLTKFIFLKPTNIIVTFWNGVKVRSQPRIGAVDVKLVLNPRAFTAEVREGWEIYRDEFWAREGMRRRQHKHNLKDHISPKKRISLIF
ncbi:hypothetical protein TPHA_0L00630 [Tetrapisispora phaffii CBS 4417]|uniref:Uncharacterized protein n=1 Tax=Tetrapisispora phaffii (strain ATCC 24235 / CBS 4417 / NBRC 1672 / NRRL Y-8282 / UCD 70-5) TaxID=1071381 RepID=G8BZU1_TETPH|nr:hypothetical protein TPHA_0L00630 [Tetrapisispora phaffii CBS 4417]CCE65419.1 hypothetical protein TPHA_0L00630 [Tetrapisispora phaffii CBS 4417]